MRDWEPSPVFSGNREVKFLEKFTNPLKNGRYLADFLGWDLKQERRGNRPAVNQILFDQCPAGYPQFVISLTLQCEQGAFPLEAFQFVFADQTRRNQFAELRLRCITDSA